MLIYSLRLQTRPLLERAAEIVTCIRARVADTDSANPPTTVRMLPLLQLALNDSILLLCLLLCLFVFFFFFFVSSSSSFSLLLLLLFLFFFFFFFSSSSSSSLLLLLLCLLLCLFLFFHPSLHPFFLLSLSLSLSLTVDCRLDVPSQAQSLSAHIISPQIEGASHEYLFSLKKNPSRNPDKFVRGLVHHTLRNTSGYVSGLTAEQIDGFIAEYDPALQSGNLDENARNKMRTLLTQLAVAWGNACTAVGAVLSVNPDDFIRFHNRWDVPKLERLVSEAWALTHAACDNFADLQTRKRRKHKKRKGAAGSIPPHTPHATPISTPKISQAKNHDFATAISAANVSASTTADHAELAGATASRKRVQPWGLARDHAAALSSEEEEEEESPVPAPAAPEKPFSVGVQTVEQDITEIHEQLQRLTKALIEEDGHLQEYPEQGKALVLVLLHRCQEYIEALANDMMVIKGLHLPAALEGEEVTAMFDFFMCLLIAYLQPV